MNSCAKWQNFRYNCSALCRLGDRIYNEFFVFYNNALGGSQDIQKLLPLSQKTASLCGSDDYWKTPFDDVVGKDPKELSDLFYNKFSDTFSVYCRFPQEKMLACVFAAQKVVNSIKQHNTIEIEKAASIIAEYGWRTSHFWK